MNAGNNTWQLQTAKNRFSEVINYALSDAPQLVTRNGKPAVYIISAESYEKNKKNKGKSLKSLLLNSPCKNIELDISRDKSDSGRRVGL
jgi:antitoxin Phd